MHNNLVLHFENGACNINSAAVIKINSEGTQLNGPFCWAVRLLSGGFRHRQTRFEVTVELKTELGRFSMIKRLRENRNWSQEQLATMSGLSVRTIQRIESGNKASLESLKSLAAVFEVDISTLTERTH